jgi:hypothetical protein
LVEHNVSPFLRKKKKRAAQNVVEGLIMLRGLKSRKFTKEVAYIYC